jgi:hypothetical protein
MVERAAGLLPMPGPITAFAFLNTLQALEDLPFDVGMQKGAALYGCQPYLSEESYRNQMVIDRIHIADLVAVLRDDLGERGPPAIGPLGTTRYELRLAMLHFRCCSGRRPSCAGLWSRRTRSRGSATKRRISCGSGSRIRRVVGSCARCCRMLPPGGARRS